MTEKELISKLKELKKIQPSREWVLYTKRKILAKETDWEKNFSPSFTAFFKNLFFHPQRAFTFSLILVGLFFALTSFAQNSLPGDFLYPLKKIAEKSYYLLVPESKKPDFLLSINEKRLAELDRIARSGQTKSLFPAINEVEETRKETAKEISKIVKEKGGEVAVKSIEKYLHNKEKTMRVFGTLGIEPELSQEDEKLYAEFLIKDWEKRALNENQELLLKEAKILFEKKDFSAVLNLLINQPELDKGENQLPDLQNEINIEERKEGFDSSEKELKTPKTENRTPTLDNRTPTLDNRTPALDNRTPALDNRTPTLDNRKPKLTNLTPMINNR
jgi:hypothetical protein